MKKTFFTSFMVITLLLFHASIAKAILWPRYAFPQGLFFTPWPMGYSLDRGLGQPFLPPLLPVSHSLQPSLPLPLMPGLKAPKPVLRSAATVTIFISPSQSVIQVTTLPLGTVSVPPTALTNTVIASSSIGFLQPAILTIATNPYVQTQSLSVSLTGTVPVAPLAFTIAPVTIAPIVAGAPFI